MAFYGVFTSSLYGRQSLSVPAEPGNIVTRGSTTVNTVVKEHTGYARDFYTIWTSSHVNRSLLYKPSMSKPKLNVNSNTNVKTPTPTQQKVG